MNQIQRQRLKSHLQWVMAQNHYKRTSWAGFKHYIRVIPQMDAPTHVYPSSYSYFVWGFGEERPQAQGEWSFENANIRNANVELGH